MKTITISNVAVVEHTNGKGKFTLANGKTSETKAPTIMVDGKPFRAFVTLYPVTETTPQPSAPVQQSKPRGKTRKDLSEPAAAADAPPAWALGIIARLDKAGL